jgi:purine-binding chemotaxis protein CheW
MGNEAESEGRGQYLTLHVGGSEYVIAVRRVRQIVRYVEGFAVESGVSWIRGVVTVQGSPIPVVDLAAKLAAAPSGVTATTCVVVVEASVQGERIAMGILADDVSQVIGLRAEDIAPPPKLGATVRLEYLRGLARVGERLALLLDVDRLLSADEALALAAVVEQTATVLSDGVSQESHGTPAESGGPPAASQPS